MKPLIIFDLETTGTDVVLDKAIQFAGMKVEEGKEPVEKNVLFNPGRPIPQQAIDVHHITDEMVKDKPPFSSYAKSLFAWLDGCDYGGHNIKQFDVPMLAEEFARCGITWPVKGARFFDTLHVFREKEKRDLVAAMQFYCGLPHEDAHDALADVRASYLVLQGQMKRYEDLNTLDKFAEFCHNPKALDLAGKLELNDEGVACYAFGKSKGKPILSDTGYGWWMISGSFPTDTKNILKAILTAK